MQCHVYDDVKKKKKRPAFYSNQAEAMAEGQDQQIKRTKTDMAPD